MKPFRVIFMGTPQFAKHHLEELIKDDSQFLVVGVISQPDRPAGRRLKLQKSAVKLCAESNGIDVISPISVRSPDVLAKIKSWQADCVVVVAFGQILPPDFLSLFPDKVVNIHASLLPKWRGAAPFQRALMAGDTETGVALQVMVSKLDAGPIICSKKIAIGKSVDARELHDQLMLIGPELLKTGFVDYLQGEVVPLPQDESEVTLAKKILKSEALINWSQAGNQVYNHLRGMTLGPGTYTWRQGKKLKICWGTLVDWNAGVASAGLIVAVGEDFFVVMCRERALKVSVVQPQSKARMDVRSYLQGYPMTVGERLGIVPEEL